MPIRAQSEIPRRSNIFGKKLEYFFTFALALLFWLTLLGSTGTLKSGFHLVDDHEVIRIHYEFTHGSGLIDTIQKWVVNDLKRRLRTFYYFHRVLETYLLGTDFFSWALYTGFLASLTSLFVYVFGRTIQLTIIESTIFVFLMLLGVHSEIWWRLGPAETIGTVAFSASLLLHSIEAGQRKKNLFLEFLALFTSLLASLSKESYILILPCIALIRVWITRTTFGIDWKKAFKYNLIPITILAAIFSGLILVVLFYVGSENMGYAGLTGFTLGRFMDAVLTLSRINHLGKYIAILSFLAVLVPARNGSDLHKNLFGLFKTYWFELMIFLSIIVPQCILYTKSGFFGRYFLPGIFGYVLLLLILLNSVRKKSLLPYPIEVVILLILLYSAFSTLGETVIPEAEAFSTVGLETGSLLKQVESETSAKGKITIVADPAVHYEPAFSLDYYLEDAAGRPNVEIEMIQNHSQYNPFLAGLTIQFRQILKGKPLYENREGELDADCIIIFPNLERFLVNPEKSRIDLKKYNRKDYDIAVVYSKKSGQ